MTKKIFSLCVALVLTLCLCSCKGYRETDSEYFVSAVCFDKQEADFKAYVEVLVISPNDKETRSKMFKATGKTPYDAVEGTTSSMPRTAVFDHCSTAIIGSGIRGKDFKKVIEYLYDTKNLNLGIYMFTADDIEGILELKPQTPSVGYDIMDIETNITSGTGVSFKNKYYEVCSRQISLGGFCLPKVSTKDNRPAISGQTVYCDYLPVITLNKEDALVFNLIYSGSSGGDIKVSNKKCKVNRVSTELKPEGNTLNINVTCRYRHSADEDDNGIKKHIKSLVSKLCGNKALKALGVSSYRKISSAEVKVNEKSD